MKLSMIVMITSCAPKRALSTPGIAADDPAAERGRDDAQRQRDQRRQPGGQHHADQRGGESARGELTLGADVEQAGAQARARRRAR